MGRKIAIISTNRFTEPYPVYPLGTAYLKSYLLDNLEGYEVEILDLNLISNEELSSILMVENFDFVCISIRNVDGINSLDNRGFINDYKIIINFIRGITKVPFIVGGSGFSIFPELFMRELNVDFGIKGEGEQTLCELIKRLSQRRDVSDIPNLYGKSKFNNNELKYLPSPQAVYESNLVEYYWKASGMLNIQTKMGCPNKCIYCTYPQIDGTCVRCMDIDLIVETIAKIKRDFGVNYWFFTDSIFNIHNSYNEKLAQALIDSKVNISWGAYFSPSNINDEQMSLYSRSGLTHIEFGTESFCDETLEAYGKRFTFEDILFTSELSLKYNVYYSHFMILGGYGDTKEQLKKTFENSKKLRYTVIFTYVGMRIYPNTIVYDRALEEGVIDKSDDLLDPKYYVVRDFDLQWAKEAAKNSGKSWIFPDAPKDKVLDYIKYKLNKKGPLWEYLRRP